MAGCSSYRYFIVEPPQFAQEVPRKQAVQVMLGPLHYEFLERHHRLAITLANSGSNAVAIVEKKSYIVSPDGQTHPVRGGNIAPNSYLAMTLPPEPRVVPSGPTFGFGMGYGYGWYPHSPWWGVYEPFYSPQAYYIYDEHDGQYWRWPKGTVRMRLNFEAQGSPPKDLDDNWVFERRRIK
jgi:hypothetical protein